MDRKNDNLLVFPRLHEMWELQYGSFFASANTRNFSTYFKMIKVGPFFESLLSAEKIKYYGGLKLRISRLFKVGKRN